MKNYPLVGVDPSNVNQGGYLFLDDTGGATHVPHPGVDFNAPHGAQADCGAICIAAAPGTVRFSGFSPGIGFGHHVWIEQDGGEWTHYAHATARLVEDGDRVDQGTPVISCGPSGGWPFCHLHFEVRRSEPPRWDWWPSMAADWAVLSAADRVRRVQEEYIDPVEWLADGSPSAPDGENGGDGMTDGERQSLIDRIAALEEDQRRANAIKAELERFAAEAGYRRFVLRKARTANVTPAQWLIALAEAGL